MSSRVQVFVANIAWKSTEDDIRQLFEENGERVESVRIMTENGKSKGFGFVTFADGRVDVDQVIQRMNGKELGGRNLLVQRARGAVQRRG